MKRLRLLVPLTLLLLGAFAASALAAARPAPHAHAAVIGGTLVPITAVPFTVFITAFPPGATEGLSCTGSIIDPVHILTAAHCVIPEGTTTVLPPGVVTVYAGTEDVSPLQAGAPLAPGSQVDPVVGISVHPLYDPKIFTDDAAVLTLAAPLNIAQPNERPIALARQGHGPRTGKVVSIAGYGQQVFGQTPDFHLYAATLRTVGDDACRSIVPTDSAVVTCAFSRTSSACHGDSGGGLIYHGVLVGIVSGGRDPCGTSATRFTDVTAPEVRAFLDGAAKIPVAARPVRYPSIFWKVTPPRVGSPLRCGRGRWKGHVSSARYTFETAGKHPKVVQRASRRTIYVPKRGAAHKRVFCIVRVHNAGGTSTARSGTTSKLAR